MAIFLYLIGCRQHVRNDTKGLRSQSGGQFDACHEGSPFFMARPVYENSRLRRDTYQTSTNIFAWLWRTFACGLMMFALCLCWTSQAVYGSDSDVTLPPRFVVRTLVSGLTLPTDMVMLPSGDFLITEKGVGEEQFSKADVRLVRQGVLQPEPVLTLGVNETRDSGISSIVLDPGFATNHFFYLWYSTGEGSLGWKAKSFNRLSRFTYDSENGKADPGSETIILDKVTWGQIHNGGAMAFDAQGNILIATGDTGAGASIGSDTDPANPAQDLTSLNGKVLRIRPRLEGGYDVPDDNPFVGLGEDVPPEIYALGLRSPFRLTQRLTDLNFYLADVGELTWEELNPLVRGANYGWPYREGKCPIFRREDDCDPAPAQFTDPILTYAHPEGGGAALTALAFYEGTQWPAEYQGKLFLADFNSDWIKMTDIDDPNHEMSFFASGLGGLVDMLATPAGIYTLSIYEGRMQLIEYVESGNLPPTAQLQLSSIGGAAPLEVTFTATGSHDEDGDGLSYQWNFGDGTAEAKTTPSTTHIYAQDGDYLATLQVTDEQSAQSEIVPQLIQVYSGAHATIVAENLTQPARILYQGGDQIRFQAVREGNTTGLDAALPYVWTILMHHHTHVHTLLSAHAGSDVLLDVSETSHAANVPLWYEVQLAMHTAGGQVLRTAYELHPQTTTIQAQSWPLPALITLNGSKQEPGDHALAIVGEQYVLEATQAIFYDRKVWQFSNWIVTSGWPDAASAEQSEIVTERRYEVVAPEQPTAYLAIYEYVRPGSLTYLPALPNSSQ